MTRRTPLFHVCRTAMFGTALIGLLAISSAAVAASSSPREARVYQDGDTAEQGGDTAEQGGDVNAQAEANTTDTGSGTVDTDYKPMLEEWRVLESELKRLQQEFNVADDANRRIIREEYNAYMQQASELLPKLEESALAAYKATPNSDEDLTRLMVGMLVNYAATDTELTDGDVKAIDLGALLIENGIADEHLQAAANAVRLLPTQREIIKEIIIRRDQAQSSALYPQVKLTIEDSEGNEKGEVILELFEDDAPNTVANFINLVEKGYYDGLTFHRVIEGFMAQGGCPEGDGFGGPGYTFADEFNDTPDYRRHFAGSLSMANTGPDANGSQFFLLFSRASHLDKKHTVFGRVISGMDVVNSIQRRVPKKPTDAPTAPNPPAPDKIRAAVVVQKRDHPYEPVVTLDEEEPETDTDNGTGDGESTEGNSDTGNSGDGATGGDAGSGDSGSGDAGTGDAGTGGNGNQ